MKKIFKDYPIDAAFLVFSWLCFFSLYLLCEAQYLRGELNLVTFIAATVTLSYLGLMVLLVPLSSIRFFAYMNGLLSLPLILFTHLVAPFLLSFIRMYIGVLFVFLALYLAQRKLLPLVRLPFEDTTCLYIALTATIIFYSLFGNVISFYTSRLIFISDSNSIERYSIIFDQNKFSYLVYVLAFVSFVGFTFCEFNHVVIEGQMQTLKQVLLPTFATFVAWDRLISKITLFKFVGVKELLVFELQERLKPMYENAEDTKKEGKV